MNKKNAQITVHLPQDYQQAIQNLAMLDDVSASEWLYRLIERELYQVYHDAEYKLNAVKCLENHQI